MTEFARCFDDASLKGQLGSTPILSALLERWQLPGQPGGLRLAVRNGYLNFYACGQSVAKLSIVRGLPRLTVHQAYVGVEGRGRPSGVYRIFDGAALHSAMLPAAWLDEWIAKAREDHSGAEKRFVDDLIAVNPGTIDVEMALPGDKDAMREITAKDGSTAWKKVAPRMDLVVLQRGASGALELGFWEAKCANNGELRATHPHDAPVLDQLGQYRSWLELKANAVRGPRIDEVLSAYRKAAATLEALAGIARKSECEARALWREAAETDLRAVLTPGIVIGIYCSVDAEQDKRFAAKSASFEGRHREKLEAITTVVQYPDPKLGGAARPATPLPPLTGEMLPA